MAKKTRLFMVEFKRAQNFFAGGGNPRKLERKLDFSKGSWKIKGLQLGRRETHVGERRSDTGGGA